VRYGIKILGTVLTVLSLATEIAAFIEYCNHRQYRFGIGYAAPAEVYYGRRS
jgi:hypothetical protein